MRLHYVAFLAILAVMISCGDRKLANAYDSDFEADEDSVEEAGSDTLRLFDDPEPPAAVDELFEDFLYNFVADSRFRQKRTESPLPTNPEDADSLPTAGRNPATPPHGHGGERVGSRFEGLEVLSIIYEREHDLELLKDTSIAAVAAEWIDLLSGQVETFNFHRKHGQWKLTDLVLKDIGQMAMADFMRFYSAFATDSAFQLQAINQPLRLVLNPPDGEDEPRIEEITPDDWADLRPSLPLPDRDIMHLNYGQASISHNRKTLLLQGNSNGLQLKLTFNKTTRGWILSQVEW